jgi:hypothetical protein
MDTVIKTGVEMCPLASPALETSWRAIRSAIESYPAEAQRLEITIP